MPHRLARSLAAAFALSLAVPTAALAADKIVVFAAASLKNALDGVVKAYGDKGQVVVSYAASSTLAKQIEKGAPADIFVSADEDWMDYLAKKNLVDGASRQDLLGSHLVLIAPAGKPPAKPVTFPGPSLKEALGSGKLAMADVAAVPAGRYGKEALTKLGLWNSVEGQVAQAENVRAALAYVARGETPLGIVYQTDAVAEPKVEIVAKFPDDSHAPIRYPIAIVKSAAAGSAAAAFLKFTESSAAASIFERQGSTCSIERHARRAVVLTADEWTAVLLSLRVASLATAVGLPLGLLFAFVLARWRFPGRSLLDALIFLPLVLPPVVTGYLLLIVFGTHGPVGHALESCCGIVLAFRWTGAALAAGVMGFPLIVRSIRLSIEATDRRLEAAAATLGAGPIATFFTVTLPLAMPGVIAGGIIGFAKALGEFGATITFASNIPGETQTIPLAMYAYTSVPDDGGAAARLATISIVLAVGAVVVSEWLVRRWAPVRRI